VYSLRAFCKMVLPKGDDLVQTVGYDGEDEAFSEWIQIRCLGRQIGDVQYPSDERQVGPRRVLRRGA